jgi:hypothetical protein
MTVDADIAHRTRAGAVVDNVTVGTVVSSVSSERTRAAAARTQCDEGADNDWENAGSPGVRSEFVAIVHLS